MLERLVDVEKQGANVLHTFPVTTSAPATEEEPFKQKALEAAANAKLVPNEELESLNAKMHVSRGGQLTPYGDPHGVLAQTKAGLDQVVCERAYLLWEQADRPDGCADDFWHPRFRPPLSLDPPLGIPQLVRALRLVVSRACPSEPSPPLRATAPTQWHRPTPLWGADKQDRADGENTLRGPGRASFEIRRRCRLPPRLAAGTSSSIALPEARAGITQIGFYVLR
jgi:Protein of unknown function (DUF2934)